MAARWLLKLQALPSYIVHLKAQSGKSGRGGGRGRGERGERGGGREASLCLFPPIKEEEYLQAVPAYIFWPELSYTSVPNCRESWAGEQLIFFSFKSRRREEKSWGWLLNNHPALSTYRITLHT